MAPLRLQIVVQPRVLPSPSGPTPTLPEPTIKWLEICPDNLTIQQLSERLEKRFFDRNHAALNIKILKYLDDLDLFPEYRVGDIFEDINKSQASDKSYSTVKVYRNPPTREELLDPRRFESLPPNSLARPIKRPLPPLFAEATQHISSGLTDHGHPPRGYLPVQSQGRNKRQKVDAIGFQLYTDSDRPLDSLEDRPDVPLRNAHVRPSAITHVEDSQKKRRSFEPRKPTVSTRIHQGSDPYGTPISSQTGLHDVDKPLGNEVVYIPDSPVSVINAYSDDSSQPSSSEKLKRSRSPEIPTSNASSSVSQELQSQIPPVALLPPSDQQHQVQASANQRTSKPSPIVSIQVPPISQEPPVTHPDQVAVDNITKTPSPKQKEDVTQPGRLRRPKPKPPKQPPSSKVTHKTINGVRQTATSVYDPIETSEGSSHERELLRSAKRSKTSAVHEGPKSKVVQSELIRASSGARSLEPNVAQPKPISHPSSIATSGYAPFKPVLDPKTIQVQAFSPAAPTTIHDTGLSPGRPKQHEVSRKHSAGTSMQSERSSDLDSTSSTQEHQTNIEQAHQPTVASEKSQAATTKAGRRPVGLNQVLASDAGENSRGRSLKQQLDEAEENKRKAQAEFDRIAALQIEQKRLDEQTNQSAFEHSEESSFSNEVGKVAAPFAPVISNGSQQPLKAMSLEEQRAFNLKHVTPGLTKQLSGIIEKKALELQQEKDRQAAIEKQEQAARLEAHRQARLARVQASKDQEMAAQEKARDDKTAQQQRFQTQEVQGKQKLLTDQKQQEEQIKVSQGKSKLKQAQEPNKEEVVGNANAPARKRITKKTNAQHEDSPGTLPKYGSHKAQPVAKEDQTLNDGSPLASQNQAKVGDTASGQAATKVDRSHDQIDTSEGQSAAQQVVGEHSLDWLIQRSPKAIYNARLQLQLANKMLKHTKRDSTAVKTPRPASNLDPTILHDYNPASSHRAQLPAEKGSKQRQDVSKAVQQGNQSNKTFTDSEALRAAGIFARVPKNVSSGIGASDKGKSAISTLPSSSQSIRPKKVGLLKVLEAQSLGPVTEYTNSYHAGTMTPAFPSSGPKSRASSEARNSITTSPAFIATKTPTRSALRVTSGTPGRSVSFANGSDPSSQSQDVNSKSAAPISETKKGMLHRALQESNAKKTEVTNKRQKSTSSSLSAGNNVRKPAKQTKLTQHITLDIQRKDKGKGRAVRSPTPRLGVRSPRPRLGEEIIISSASEASTYYSDESEEERNARAGPSVRKRVGPILKSHRINGVASGNSETVVHADTDRAVKSIMTKTDPGRNRVAKTGIQRIGTTSSSQSSTQNGQRSAVVQQKPGAKTTSTTSGKTIGQGPSQSTSYSDSDSDSDSESGSGSESDSASEQTDDASLLPSIQPRTQEVLASSQQSSQKSILRNPTSSQQSARKSILKNRAPSPAHERLSSSLTPMSPKDRIQDARTAKLRDERMQSEEADRQLRRENEEALKKERAAREAVAEYQVKMAKEQDRAAAAYDKSALSALRKAQAAAAEPEEGQGVKKGAENIKEKPAVEGPGGSSDSDESSSSSGSEDDGDTANDTQEAKKVAQGGTSSRFAKFAREILWR